MIVLILLAVLALALCYLLYHFMTNKKLFACLLVAIFALGGLVYALLPQYLAARQNHVLTKAERQELLSQQQTFADWYADYQKDVEELNHNWSWYHQILRDYQEDNISIQTAYVRLKQLDQDSQTLRDKIAKEAPPLSLNDQCYDLVLQILQKTNTYANDQYRTIALTKAAADPANIQTDDHDALSEMLQTVMMRESPAGLYTAQEISAINDLLSMPQADDKDSDANKDKSANDNAVDDDNAEKD